MTRSVLLIDDDPGYREILVRRFSPEGYRFLEADSPLAAIRLLGANPQVRVVLLDLSLGQQSGIVMLDHLRDQAADYRVIVLTAHDELLTAEQAREYEVFNYLPKAERSSHQALRFSLDQAFKDLERTALARKIGFLEEVQRHINAGRDTKQTLDLICHAVREVVGAYTCHIRVYDFATGDFRLAGLAPNGPLRHAFSAPRSKGEFFSGKVVQSGQPEYAADLLNDAQFLEFKRKSCESRSVTREEAEYWDSVSSAYIVPISTGFFGDTVDAVLNVSSQSVAFFDAEKRALVDEFVHQASLAITKDWLQRWRDELHDDYSRISEMLGDMRDRLHGPDVLRGVCHTVTHKLSDLINAEVVSIFLYDEVTGKIRNVAEYRGTRHADALDEEYAIGQSFVGKVFERGETLHLQTTREGVKPAEDPRFDHSNTEQYGPIVPSGALEHYLGVPIRTGGKMLGVLRAMNKKSAYYDEVMRTGGGAANSQEGAQYSNFPLLERGFSADVRNVVEITASHLAIAIQNARLLSERGRQVQQLKTLSEVGRIISSELDIQTVLEQTINAMAVMMQAEICMLFLREEREDRIVLRQCYGIPETEFAGASYAMGEGVAGMVAATGKARLIEVVRANDGKYDDQIRKYLTQRDGIPREIESLMVVPIIAKSTLLGVMTVINKLGDDPHYRPSDLRLFRMFGQYVGVAIENAHIYQLTNQRLAIAERDAVLSELVRAVAHEINNTSGLIPANIAMIRSALVSRSRDVEEMLSLIEDVAAQATEFANQIAGFSASRRGERRALDVNQIVRAALREFDPKTYKAQLVVSLASRALYCALYETPFKQIVRNIVINAFQALHQTEQGVVYVSTSQSTGEGKPVAVIKIRDNGSGIRPDHLARIFDSDFTTKPTGNGIGLWLVRKQLELIGGSIEVSSEPGAGAQFIVKVPLAPPSQKQADG
jgi:signal transduction histidine kinase/ActR/RegA family two-component response regulator